MLPQIKKLFLATYNYFLLSIPLCLLIFLAEYTRVILDILTKDSNIDQDYVKETVTHSIGEGLRRLSDLPNAATITNVIIWAAIGAGVYLLYYIFSRIIIDVRNEVEQEQLESEKYGTRQVVLRRAAPKLITVLGYLIFLGLSLLVLSRYWHGMLSISVFSGFDLVTLPLLAIGLIGLTINIYLIIAGAYVIWRYEEDI